MGSSEWGHDEMCCSHECGRAYADSSQYAELCRERLKEAVAHTIDALVAFEGRQARIACAHGRHPKGPCGRCEDEREAAGKP